jgi:DNA-binding transcriptional MerR regulator
MQATLPADSPGTPRSAGRARRRAPRDASPLTTARLCASTGATRGMLRLYEAEGLLAAPQRSAAGYRHFPADTVDRVRAIFLLKELGFTLRQVSLLLADADLAPFDAPKIQALAQAQLAQIDTRIARLTVVRHYLATVAHGDAESLMTDPDCRFLADFLAAAP